MVYKGKFKTGDILICVRPNLSYNVWRPVRGHLYTVIKTVELDSGKYAVFSMQSDTNYHEDSFILYKDITKLEELIYGL